MFNSRNVNEESPTNSFSISSEIEKNLETLLDEFDSADDLNQAKIDSTQFDKIEDKQEDKIILKMPKIVTNLVPENNNDFKLNFSKNFNDLMDKEEENGKIREEKQHDPDFSVNASSSSEKYDEMIDISLDKNEKIEANVKRLSAENGSLVTQTSWKSLKKKNNLAKHNEQNNKSHSFEWSYSKSISPNLSHSHGMNSSNPMNHHKILKKLSSNKRSSEPRTYTHHENNYINENHGEMSFRHRDVISHLDVGSPTYKPANFSIGVPNRFSNSTNNSHDNSQEFKNFIKISNHSLPRRLTSNPEMLNYDMDKSFGEAFSLNRTIGSNFGPKKSSYNNGNNINNFNNNFNKNDHNSYSNDIISGTSYFINNGISNNSGGGANLNNPTYPYVNYAKNNPKTNISNYNTNKNTNTSSSFYFNMNNFLFYNDDTKILENIHSLLQEQTGCRFVQMKIEEKNLNNEMHFLTKLFEKIKDNLINIISDQFGNYVIQKFFEGIVLNSTLLTRFFQVIRKDLFQISINSFGTRFFQKSLENLTSVYMKIENEVINEIFKELIVSHSYDLIIDTNGNHVFQKILVMYPKDKNQFIFDELNKTCLEVARIKQGGCIFQRAFDLASLKQKNLLISEILRNIHFLINDEYGNFIIQSVIYLKLPEVNESIFYFLKNKLLDLSKKKFSSNVIDKVRLNLYNNLYTVYPHGRSY